MGQRFALALSILLAFGCIEARADTDGATLLKWCQSEAPSDRSGCLGYITAIVDVLESRTPILGNLACLPVTTTRVQARKIVVADLVKRPAELQYSAAGLAARALAAAFPCNVR
jgi:Ssp1 endopeptidase immunity protein Rap1a